MQTPLYDIDHLVSPSGHAPAKISAQEELKLGRLFVWLGRVGWGGLDTRDGQSLLYVGKAGGVTKGYRSTHLLVVNIGIGNVQ